MIKKVVLTLVTTAILALQAWAGGKDISASDAKAMLETNKSIFLLDVRTPQEYSQGRLTGSTLIPISEIERRIQEVPKNKPVVVYCAVGSRSRSATDFLSRQGYKDVYNMKDGIVGWYRNGFPIQR